jgi:hydroxyacylglutathione hydrolase
MGNSAAVGLDVVVDEGLGNSCYLLDLGDGAALVVDAPRDLRAVRAAATRGGLRIRFAAETHLHADFLSGAVQLAHDDGAEVLASAAGQRGFSHRGMVDGEEIDLGGLRLQAWATPGHTDEHVSFLLLEDSAPVGVFSGGSMIVGSAARTDLLGEARTQELTRAQHASLRRLAALPAETRLWPTHGAGSFCSAPPGAERTSTIGRERETNPLLGLDEDAFVAQLHGSLGSYPPYFRRLGEINRRGPAVLDTTRAAELAVLPISIVQRLRAAGALLIDVRPLPDYAAGHVPGALSIPLRDQFATWLGWLTPADTPLVVIRNPDQDPGEVVWQSLKIGYEQLAGELAGGTEAWRAAGQPLATTELLSADQIGARRVLDIRQRPEYVGGHVPAAVHVELGDVAAAAAAGRVKRAHKGVMCGDGERAAGAASLLERAGHVHLAVLAGGPDDWADATGRPLQTGA